MTKSASVSDVARVAGVSTATVSRALRFPDKVGPATLSRVLKAVDQLRYVVDGAARALRSRQTHTVGALIPSLHNAFFAHATDALQRELAQRGYALVLGCYEFDLKLEVTLGRILIERGIDGLVLIGLDHERELLELLDHKELPYVISWSVDQSNHYPFVGIDNRKATALLTTHLWELGHRRFAIISGMVAHNDRARERVEGVLQVLGRHGVRLRSSNLLEVPFSVCDGALAMGRILQQKQRPTAVICVNDVLAVGALSRCREKGVAVPNEISIAGFGDLEIAAHQTPPLTTLHTPTHELGRVAAQHLLGRIAGERVIWQTELPVTLITRQSTAPPPSRP